MYSFVFLTFIYLIQASHAVTTVHNTVPVFMLDYEQIMMHVQIDPNPFDKLQTSTFSEIIHDSAKRSAGVIIFVEETFSVECVSTKDRYFGTPYKNLHTILRANNNKVKYFPSVVEPYRLLKQIFPPEKNNVFHLTPRTKIKLEDNFKYLYIYFRDGGDETKAEILRRHDTIIKDVVGAVRQLKPGPVVAYYTGKVNPIDVKAVEFVKRLPPEKSRMAGVLVVSPRALFRLYGVTSTTPTRRSSYDQPPTVSKEVYNIRTLTTRLNFGNFELEWGFTISVDDQWLLDHISIIEGDEEVGRVNPGVGAPINCSYYCPEPMHIMNTRDGSRVTFNEILIEPVRDRDRMHFSEAYVHCQPFFSASILSTFWVLLLLLLILMYGIVTLMNCATNDRYEDPNSKPLVHEMLH